MVTQPSSGAVILAKMGYRGGGLGKYNQGMLSPIIPLLLPKSLGLGCSYKDTTLQKSHQDNNKPLSPTTAFALPPRNQAKVNNPSELQRNGEVIQDLTELDLLQIQEIMSNQRETLLGLLLEEETGKMDPRRQNIQLAHIEKLLRVLDAIEEKISLGLLTLDSLADCFTELNTRFKDDYNLCNFSSIACSFALPLFIRLFQGWNPLTSPLHGLQMVAVWKNLLHGEDNIFMDVVSPFTHLIMEVVVPPLRISGINYWDARDPEPMLRFLELWDALLPALALQTILDDIVMPKLSEAVDTWDPRRETVPIHAWVHPWLPLLGQKLDSLHKTICHKLGTVLHTWHPRDASAYTLLSPWKSVFDAASWENLMVRFILPKLQAVMQDFQINPAHQNFEQFNWVKSWASIIPIHHMVSLFEVFFFGKWHQVLYHWLCSNPDFWEVTKWYLGWKEQLPKELLENKQIQQQLNIALDMMNHAVEGMEVVQPGLRENISYFRAIEQRELEGQLNAAAFAQQHATAGLWGMDDTSGFLEMSFEEIIEVYAQEQELLFKPIAGLMHNGYQVYGFGNISIIMDSVNQMVFAKTDELWSLVSLDQLVEMHDKSILNLR